VARVSCNGPGSARPRANFCFGSNCAHCHYLHRLPHLDALRTCPRTCRVDWGCIFGPRRAGCRAPPPSCVRRAWRLRGLGSRTRPPVPPAMSPSLRPGRGRPLRLRPSRSQRKGSGDPIKESSLGRVFAPYSGRGAPLPSVTPESPGRGCVASLASGGGAIAPTITADRGPVDPAASLAATAGSNAYRAARAFLSSGPAKGPSSAGTFGPRDRRSCSPRRGIAVSPCGHGCIRPRTLRAGRRIL
jgi:hypothetical protein